MSWVMVVCVEMVQLRRRTGTTGAPERAMRPARYVESALHISFPPFAEPISISV